MKYAKEVLMRLRLEIRDMKREDLDIERELERIEQSVREAAGLGYRKAVVKGLINKDTRKTLEEAGYRVKLFDDQREGRWTEIYWGDYYE